MVGPKVKAWSLTGWWPTMAEHRPDNTTEGLFSTLEKAQAYVREHGIRAYTLSQVEVQADHPDLDFCTLTWEQKCERIDRLNEEKKRNKLIAEAARAEELFSADELEEHARKTRESGGG